MRHPEFPVVSFLCIILLLCSLPSHIRAASISTIALIAWLTIMSLIRGINALIWANNCIVKVPVWCDISTKIPIGFTYAVPASALCIMRHLESVASMRSARTTRSDKRRRQRFEAIMCFGVPAIGMALHYIVQGHRFDLFEDIGCAPTVYFSLIAIIIIWAPPLVMSMITFVYASMVLRHFLRHRIEFATRLLNSQSALTPGRYFRLMAMALVEMIWDTGVNAYIIYFNTFAGLRPWINWQNVHSDFSRVQLFPAFLIPPELMAQLLFQWWILPISSVAFFIFFGFGQEAMSDYRAAFYWFRRNILRHRTNNPCTYVSTSTLPTTRPHHLPAVNITLSKIPDDASDHDSKAQSGLSFKVTEVTDNLPPSPTPVAVPERSFYVTHVIELPKSRVSSASMSASFSTPSFVRGNHGDLSQVATPNSDVDFAGFIQPVIPSSSPSDSEVLQSDFSTSTSQSFSRRSVSSDLGITVSPAHHPPIQPPNLSKGNVALT